MAPVYFPKARSSSVAGGQGSEAFAWNRRTINQGNNELYLLARSWRLMNVNK